nr:MAG TPA: vacuolar sorting protein [Caudoviricetes sp.]
MTSRECETCIKRKTVYCPTSMECMATDDKPYYQNRIMLLEENQELKKQLEEYKKDIEDLDNQNQRAFKNMQLNQLKTCNMIKQQKEFIKWLEKKQSFLRDEISELTLGMCNTDFQDIKIEVYGKVLQKYKEIIGDDK